MPNELCSRRLSKKTHMDSLTAASACRREGRVLSCQLSEPPVAPESRPAPSTEAPKRVSVAAALALRRKRKRSNDPRSVSGARGGVSPRAD